MEPWKKDPWFFCEQVVMETNRILIDAWRPYRGHGDFHGNMKKNYCFLFEKFKKSLRSNF